MASTRPTLRSLAREAGVSPMTFSLALRNSREVSAKTRARLQDLAFRAGYRPDPQVSKLMHHLRTRRKARVQANLCAMTHAWKLGRFPAGSFPHRLDASLRSRADALGYTLEFLNLDDYPTARQLQRVLVNRGIEGLLLLPLREPTDLSRRLDWSLFSTVSVTSSLIAPKLHSVTPNHYDNTLKACRELAAAGFRRIGIAMASDWDKRVSHRWSGGIAWQNQFGGTEPVRPLIGDKPGTSLDAGIFARWLGAERPDAVILEALNHDELQRVLAELPASRRPRIATMNWPSPLADFGIDQNVERIGTVAVDILASMLTRGEKGIPLLPDITMIEGTWTVPSVRT